MGGLQAKSMTSQRNRAEPSQDGGYALLWKRYDILHLQQYSHRLNLLYSYVYFMRSAERTVYSSVVIHSFLMRCEHTCSVALPFYVVITLKSSLAFGRADLKKIITAINYSCFLLCCLLHSHS